MSDISRHFASAVEAALHLVRGMELKLLPLCFRSLHRKDMRARPQNWRATPSLEL